MQPIKKILVSAAIFTGLIAPAMYAAVNGGNTPEAQKRGTESQKKVFQNMKKTMSGSDRGSAGGVPEGGWSGSVQVGTGVAQSKIPEISKSKKNIQAMKGCIATATRNYETKKKQITQGYTSTVKKSQKYSHENPTLSGEKKIKNMNIKNLQEKYLSDMTRAREDYMSNQRLCISR